MTILAYPQPLTMTSTMLANKNKIASDPPQFVYGNNAVVLVAGRL